MIQVQAKATWPSVSSVPRSLLFGAHRPGGAQVLRQRELLEGDLTPVGEPARYHLQELLGGVARRVQTLDNPLRLLIERHRIAGPGVEDRHPHRRGLDQGLKVGPGPLLVPVAAGVGDGRRRLRREQHQDLFVLVRELPATLLLGKKEGAEMHASMAHRRGLQGLRRHQVRGKAERPEVAGQVSQPHRSRNVPEVLEEPRPIGPVLQLLPLFRGEARGDVLQRLPRVVDGRDRPVAGAGQCPGALDDLVQDGADVEARADAQDRPAQPGHAVAKRLVLSPQLVGALRGGHLVSRFYQATSRQGHHQAFRKSRYFHLHDLVRATTGRPGCRCRCTTPESDAGATRGPAT